MPIALHEIQNIRALAHLTPPQLEKLAYIMTGRTYVPGEFIFLEGTQASGIWFVVEGKVRIIKQSFQGRIQGLCVVSSGRCFGGCPLFDGAINPASAQALTEVRLAILNAEDSESLQHQDPELLLVLLQIFSQRLDHLAHLSEGLGAWNVATRINDCLILHANQENTVTLTHEKLAEMVGTAREVVTRHLSDLEKQGVIQAEAGKIYIMRQHSLQTSCLGRHVT